MRKTIKKIISRMPLIGLAVIMTSFCATMSKKFTAQTKANISIFADQTIWLHDVVEDTPATLDDIDRQFGASVAQLVRELTDTSKPEAGNRATRKAIDRKPLAKASGRAQTIKLADLIDNCKESKTAA